MNYIVLVHIISIQTKQNETSNKQGARTPAEKNIYIGYSLESNVLNTH